MVEHLLPLSRVVVWHHVRKLAVVVLLIDFWMHLVELQRNVKWFVKLTLLFMVIWFRALAFRPSYSPPTQHQSFFRYLPSFNLLITIHDEADDFVELMLKTGSCFARLWEILIKAKMSAGNTRRQICADIVMDIFFQLTVPTTARICIQYYKCCFCPGGKLLKDANITFLLLRAYRRIFARC